MTKEEQLDWLCRLRSEIYVYMPREWLIPMKNALDMTIQALEQEPKTEHWIYDKTLENWRCSKCNETPKTMGYVGTADFMAEQFKFCNHCGARMESEE